MKAKENIIFSYVMITIIYVLATIIGIITYRALSYSPYINLLIADIVATALVFVFSLIFDNASAYDPYWSVQPLIIGLFFGLDYGFNAFTIILFAVICIWGIRLTINWTFDFRNFTYQDWRYVYLKEKTKWAYSIINFIGIHLVPTLVVYACSLPMVFAFINQPKFNYFSLIFIALSLLAIGLEFFADIQMRKYRKDKKTPFIRTGLWKYSRHPNYLGEILMWWGVALATIICMPSMWYLILGAFLNTLLFMFVSIPLADGKQSKKQGFSEYRKQTRMLLPIYKKQ